MKTAMQLESVLTLGENVSVHVMSDFPDKKYKIIYADPPWMYEDRAIGGERGADSKYDVMTIEEICKLPVKQITDDDCILFVWGTWTHMKEVQQVIESWGFTYKTVGFVWIKKFSTGRNFMGMGYWTRANTEYCLIATKGHPKKLDAGISQIIETIPKRHSQKPDEVRSRILKLCGDLPRIELFARTLVSGWTAVGNEVDGQDIKTSLQQIIDGNYSPKYIKGEILDTFCGNENLFQM